jgi:hypothetical protein
MTVIRLESSRVNVLYENISHRIILRNYLSNTVRIWISGWEIKKKKGGRLFIVKNAMCEVFSLNILCYDQRPIFENSKNNSKNYFYHYIFIFIFNLSKWKEHLHNNHKKLLRSHRKFENYLQNPLICICHCEHVFCHMKKKNSSLQQKIVIPVLSLPWRYFASEQIS